MYLRRKLIQLIILVVSLMTMAMNVRATENFGIDQKLKTYLVQETMLSHAVNFKKAKEWASKIFKQHRTGKAISPDSLKLLTDYYVKGDDAKRAGPFLTALLKNKNIKLVSKENEMLLMLGNNTLKTSLTISAHNKIILNDQEYAFDGDKSFEENIKLIQKFIAKTKKVVELERPQTGEQIEKYFSWMVDVIVPNAWGVRNVSTQAADSLDNAILGGILLLGEGFNSLPWFNFYNARDNNFKGNFWQLGSFIIDYKNKCQRDLERDPEIQDYSFTYEGSLPLLVAIDKMKDHPDNRMSKQANGLVSEFFGSEFKGKLSCATLLAKVKNFNMHAITAYTEGIASVRERWSREYNNYCSSYEQLRECLETLAHREHGRIVHERSKESGESSGDYDYSQDAFYQSR